MVLKYEAPALYTTFEATPPPKSKTRSQITEGVTYM